VVATSGCYRCRSAGSGTGCLITHSLRASYWLAAPVTPLQSISMTFPSIQATSPSTWRQHGTWNVGILQQYAVSQPRRHRFISQESINSWYHLTFYKKVMLINLITLCRPITTQFTGFTRGVTRAVSVSELTCIIEARVEKMCKVNSRMLSACLMKICQLIYKLTWWQLWTYSPSQITKSKQRKCTRMYPKVSGLSR
jgi:hypothetical protein